MVTGGQESPAKRRRRLTWAIIAGLYIFTAANSLWSRLRTLARKAVMKYGLTSCPDIGKGCWLARETFPPGTPYRMYQRAVKELANLDPEASHLRRAAVTDAFLRSMLATRIQGNIDLDRVCLLELIREYVLDGDGWRELEGIIQEGEQPDRICCFVSRVLRARYGTNVGENPRDGSLQGGRGSV